ncbi:hypothetical protein KPP03845_200271 (plasmid) [Streptomyces xanthophaeus]|uniref:hypothetical protein n=1 Tax=Streptomyces xanthophaeus TaxID=67385 RepID=UPI00233E760B|nr:hypothetical protein [Streptomyces xanthophaeus]WCD91310.1 hypothetical protein KPP03845_200271 [Streptomyces xanthophaeus]
MTEETEGRDAMWAGGKTLYDVVPVLNALIETIGRDLVLEEYSLARTAADMAAAMIVEQRESTGIADERTALLVVRALAESAAATERALDGSSS